MLKKVCNVSGTVDKCGIVSIEHLRFSVCHYFGIWEISQSAFQIRYRNLVPKRAGARGRFCYIREHRLYLGQIRN